MRLKALLFTAGLAVASAGTAAAAPSDAACAGKTWLAELVCKAHRDAAPAQTAPAEESNATIASTTTKPDGFSFLRSLMPRTTWDWFRDQLGKSTMISSSARPSTSPAATAPSDATRRKDGTFTGTRSP